MKKTIAKIISFIAVISMLASLAIPAQAAKKPEFLLALGDSITTGFGLENYMDGDDAYRCDSYISLIASALGLKGKESYINKAVNGATSKDLIEILPDLTNYLAYSDLVVVTIGGNDLLGAIPLVASAISGKTVTSLESSINVLTKANPNQFAQLAKNTTFQTKMGKVLSDYAENITATAEIIKQNAPEARVIFVKQYNPMKNVLGFADFGDFADNLIASINTSIDQVCAAYGFEVLDAPKVIDVNAAALTNMLNYDIHPNAAGHVEIAKLLAEHLEISLDPSENTELETDPITEPVTELETEPETDPVIEPDTDAVTEPTTCVVPTTAPVAEEKGCASAISSAVILLALCGASFVLKKKND